MKPAKHQRSKQRCQHIRWKVSNLLLRGHELRNQNVSFSLFLTLSSKQQLCFNQVKANKENRNLNQWQLRPQWLRLEKNGFILYLGIVQLSESVLIALIKLKTCSNWKCNASCQFQKEITEICHCGLCSPKHTELVFCRGAYLLFCPLNILLSDVFVPVPSWFA